jgi:hypothetical protein
MSFKLAHQYAGKKYLHARRLRSYIVQSMFLKQGEEVLEIGPGPGIFAALAKNISSLYHSMDYTPEVPADFHGDVSDPQLPQKIGRTYDAVFCCQVLEHVPYEKSLVGLQNLQKLARKRLIISVPDNRIGLNFNFSFTKFDWAFVITIPFSGKKVTFESHGEHYWEINHKNLNQIKADFANAGDMKLVGNFRCNVRPYQHFFVFERG